MRTLIIFLLAIAVTAVNAQNPKKLTEEQRNHLNVVTGRADKIVDNLDIADVAKAERVRDYIAWQYFNLSQIHDSRDAAVKSLRDNGKLSQTARDKRIDQTKAKADKEVSALHKRYIKQLESELTSEQVDKVKDGMTYGVVPITYAGYLDMLPELTDEEKAYIWDQLIEAREHAMNGGSSREKHGWFGRYKGRINNYLAARGYDLKKASEAREARMRQQRQ